MGELKGPPVLSCPGTISPPPRAVPSELFVWRWMVPHPDPHSGAHLGWSYQLYIASDTWAAHKIKGHEESVPSGTNYGTPSQAINLLHG